jgi:anaerobic ribonucleoside-triphosphate reductase activating protein
MYLSVAKIVSSTSVDGVGLRNSLYVSGCPIHCEGCHNSKFWDIQSGTQMSVEEVCNKLNEDEFNISILGGEPLMQYEEILALCKMIKTRYPHKTIWMWSGYGLSLIRERYTEILRYIDTLVDGPFIKALASSELLWRGSSNQRVIDKAQFFSEAIC